MINDLLKIFVKSSLANILKYFGLFFTKIFQNKFIILILFTTYIVVFSNSSSAQNQSANSGSVNNQTNQTQETQTNQPSLADRIESNLPKDIKIDNNNKNSVDAVVVDNSKNKSPYLSQLSTLMFSEEEQSSINTAIDSFKNGTAFLPQESENKEQEDESLINKKAYLYLASIMYVNNRYWAVWINDQKITSDNNLRTNEIYIRNIQRDRASIIWTIGLSKWKVLMGSKAEEKLSEVNAENQVIKKIQLKPNQTYILLSETIVEGNSPNIPIISKKAENNLQTNNPDNILNQQIQNNNLQQPNSLQPTNITNKR